MRGHCNKLVIKVLILLKLMNPNLIFNSMINWLKAIESYFCKNQKTLFTKKKKKLLQLFFLCLIHHLEFQNLLSILNTEYETESNNKLRIL